MEAIIKLENINNEYILLKDELLYEMVDEAYKITRNLRELSKLTDIQLNKLLKFHTIKNRRRVILISDLKKLSNFLLQNNYKQYSLEELQNKIISIGRHRNIINPKFPIDFSKLEGASFLGDLLTDGFLDSRYHAGFSSTDPLQIIQNIQSINKLICEKNIKLNKGELNQLTKEPLNLLKLISKRSSINCSISVIKTKKQIFAYTVRYPRYIGKLIKVLGIPKGRRVYTNPSIPEYLFTASEKSIFKFFERVFINEAQIKTSSIVISHSIDITKMIPNELKFKYLNFPNKYNKKLKIYLKKNKIKIPNLIKGYKLLFNKINCNPKGPIINSIYLTKNNEIHVNWKVWITGKDLNIIKDNCNIDKSIKWSPLKERDNFTTRYKLNERLDQVIILADKLSEFKSRDIAKILNISQESVNNYLRKIIKENLVRRYGGSRNIKYKSLI